MLIVWITILKVSGCQTWVGSTSGPDLWLSLSLSFAEYVRPLEVIVSHKLDLLSKLNGMQCTFDSHCLRSSYHPRPSLPPSERIRDLHERLKEEENASKCLKGVPSSVVWLLFVLVVFCFLWRTICLWMVQMVYVYFYWSIVTLHYLFPAQKRLLQYTKAVTMLRTIQLTLQCCS